MYISFSSSDQVVSELLAAQKADALWLLCVAVRHGDQLATLIDACKERGIRICGGLFPGVIHGESTLDHGMVAIPLPPISQLALADLTPSGVTWRLPPPALTPHADTSATILVDCLAPNIASLLEDIYDRYGNRVSYVGAGAGHHDLRAAPPLFTEQGWHAHAGLLILSPQRTSVEVRHGWKRVRGPFVASRTRGNVIQEINWEPAGTFYRGQVIVCDADYANRPVFPDINAAYPLSIGKEDGEDVIRDPIGVTAADELVVLSDVTENSVMYLAHGDGHSLLEAARSAAEACRRQADIERCFVSICYSRSLTLGNALAQEMEAVCRSLAGFTEAIPEGVLALGEIGADGNRNIEFFNKTIVVAAAGHPNHE